MMAGDFMRHTAMRLEAWKFLTESWDRAARERERLEKAALIFFEDIARDDWLACSRLIERGCSPNMALGQRTPAMAAAENGAINALKLLASAGANLGAQDEQGRDAIHFAVQTRSDEALGFLLGKGARPKRLFADHSTALIAAARGSYVQGVRLLVANDKHSVDQYDRMGRTALWHVLSKPDPTDADNEIAKILMGNGANPNLSDLEGVSARDASASEASKSLLERHDIDAALDVEPDAPAPASAPNKPRGPRL
jgi:hypothetical protein